MCLTYIAYYFSLVAKPQIIAKNLQTAKVIYRGVKVLLLYSNPVMAGVGPGGSDPGCWFGFWLPKQHQDASFN
ncbi:hypothetical protein D3C87_380650 [compost metagenome]